MSCNNNPIVYHRSIDSIPNTQSHPIVKATTQPRKQVSGACSDSHRKLPRRVHFRSRMASPSAVRNYRAYPGLVPNSTATRFNSTSDDTKRLGLSADSFRRYRSCRRTSWTGGSAGPGIGVGVSLKIVHLDCRGERL